MSCTSPIRAYKEGKTENGKDRIFFCKSKDYHNDIAALKVKYGDNLLLLPCGKCLSCRLDYAKQWAIRCVLEASMYEDNCFLTLTFDDEHLPDKVSKNDLTNFIKRLRNFAGDQKLKFFACGEYGSLTHRPHYHVIIFNFNFKDLKFLKMTDAGEYIYTSKTLEKLWPYGMSSVGEVSINSCSYVARYCSKQTNKKDGEFIHMSRRPGIARLWFDEHPDIYKSDSIVGNFGKSHIVSIPRYFDKLAEANGIDISDIKRMRIHNSELFNNLNLALHDTNSYEELYKLFDSLLTDKSKTLKRGL